MNRPDHSFREITTICLMIFLASLFCVIAITSPGLQVNDEWITTNQLHQLSQGHQIVTNEGKYGTVLGEQINYFKIRNNILGYSLCLPFTALIPLYAIQILGDNFRLFIIFFWISIPVIISVLYQIQYPEKSLWRRIPFIIPVMVGCLILLFICLRLYYPFHSSFEINPIESAALVLSAHIEFAFLAVVLFLIGLVIYNSKRTAVLFPILIITGSSYLFWATNAKDHLLTALIIGGVLLFFILYSYNSRKKYTVFGFLLLGLLMWVRPEVGFTLLVFITLWYLFNEMRNRSFSLSNYKKTLSVLLIPLSFFIGAIPFLINNYLLTQNPLYPIFLQYEPSLVKETTHVISNLDGGTGISNVTPSSLHSSFDIWRIFYIIGKYYSFVSRDPLTDLGRTFFFTDSGCIGIFPIAPLLFIAFLTIPAILISRWSKISSPDKKIILLCIFSSCAIFLSYLRSFQDMPASEGIGPDLRYYSAIYIPGGVLGLISMKYWNINPVEKITWKNCIIALLIGTPVIIITMLIFQPFGGGYPGFTFFLSVISMLLVIIMIFQYLMMESGIRSDLLLRLNMLLMIVIPFTWQIILVFLFSIAKFDGFSFWIPITEAIFTWFIIPVS